PAGPAGRPRDRGEAPDLPGEAARLRVDEPPRRVVPQPVGRLLGLREPVRDLVAEPPVELGEPVVDAPLAPLGRLRVPAPAVALAARRPPCRALGALAPLLRPLGDAPGTRPGLDHAVRPQEQQPEDVLARDLPARARAPERRPGQV